MRISAEVRDALAARAPVVALESTIIAHGLPRPRNLEVAVELEEILRAADVVPATIGVVHGEPTVGLDHSELQLLATADDVVKAGVRELPLAIAAGRHAATTVAATSHLAHRCGIPVFATGGIGGVHRGAADTFDESSDLVALGRTGIVVVAAGVKSVLDVAATLERLETLGVTVVGYHTTKFPGFYLADSGFDLGWCVSCPAEVVDIARAAAGLGLTGAVLVANPVPVEEQLDPATHDAAIAAALAAADREGVRGSAVTPYLLDHLYRATGGASLTANIAAVRNNVRLAAAIARAWVGV